MTNVIGSNFKLFAMIFLAATLGACGGGATTDSGASSSVSSVDQTGVTSTTSNANGAVTLNWTPPIENTDGSALTDLNGYTIYYGTAADDLSASIDIDNEGLTSYVVENLNSGTVYYFAITANNDSGISSGLSNTVSANVTG